MIRSHLLPGLFAGALILATAGDAGAETYEIDGRRLRVRLDPDWPAAMVGEPLFLSLTIENLGPRDLFYGDGFTRNRMGRPDFISLETVRAQGTVVPLPDAGPSMGGAYGPRRLRPGERQAKRLFLPHWAEITEPGIYTITCRRTYEFYEEGPSAGRQEPEAGLEVVLATRIEIDPHDPAKVPAMLERWSWAVGGPSTDAAGEAIRALAHVTDPRVIAPLQSGIASGHYDIMLPCITALAKFEDDQALAGLRMAMRLDASDLKGMPNPTTAESLRGNLRGAAAGTLARSRNPEARVVLRTYEEDADPGVRLNVVHASGMNRDPEDVALLERRARDANDLVRGEAQRYLRELEANRGTK